MFGTIQSGRNAEILLKRQIPILSNDHARSWLGGNPKVSAGMPWPRTSEGVPLQFIAQVACEDFPAELWNGLGPRSGSLLLFANVFNLDGIYQKGEVQVVHVDEIGSEMEPPNDCPVSRHAMLTGSLRGHDIEHPGVPKLWRKWPVDFIVHEYKDTNDPTKRPYLLYRSAEEIYSAPVEDRVITAKDLGVERPLTWRGALYVVEGILASVGTPEKFKRNFVGMKLGLIDVPPEPDPRGFNEEFERRRKANPDFAGGDWSAWGAARTALKSAMQAERRDGWLARARPALMRDIGDWKQLYTTEVSQLDANRHVFGEAEISRRQFNINHRAERLKEMELDLLYLDELSKAYPGPEGEKKLSAQFKELGEAYLERGNRMIQRLGLLRAGMRGRDLDSLLSLGDWDEIKCTWEDVAGPIWKKHDSRLAQRVELNFQVQQFIEPAIREDLLDLYTGDNAAEVALEPALIAEIEARVRSFGQGARHQIGGQLIPIQSELDHDPSRVLLFQISSDSSLGWMWGDMGNLYVTMSKADLKSHRFENIEARLEFH